jgi:hypothetical protein
MRLKLRPCMTTSSSSDEHVRSRAWLLHAEIAVTGHPWIANIQTDQILTEYVSTMFGARDSVFAQRMKGLILVSFSMPTALSYRRDPGFVPVVGILYDLRVVCASTVENIFSCVDGLTARWGPLHFCPGTTVPSLNDHPAYKTFLRESSLGRMDPALMWRVDYKGVSDARQDTIASDEERARTWKFVAVINVAHHPDLITCDGEIPSNYFQMRILPQIQNWVEKIETWDLISFSVLSAAKYVQLICKRLHFCGGIFPA